MTTLQAKPFNGARLAVILLSPPSGGWRILPICFAPLLERVVEMRLLLQSNWL